MKLRFPNLPHLGRAFVAVKHLRWRDPLVQVWGLIGVVLVAGIVTHYVRSRDGGEQKNTSWAAELLHSQESDGWRPAVSLAEKCEPRLAPAPAGVDLRGCATAAAGRKAWRFLPSGIRQEIAAQPAAVRSLVVTWSGTPGGNAGALDLYYAGVRDESGGTPADFIIGNGQRSRDGGVELTHRWHAVPREQLPEWRLCLVGDGTAPTAAQLAALGELISCIEARHGHLALAMHAPAAPELLAHRD